MTASAMTGDARERAAWRALIALAAVLVACLQVVAIDRQSLTSDEPYHLAAGITAVRYGQNVLNLEHPPLVKLVAALPLRAEGAVLPLLDVSRWREAAAAVFHDRALTLRAQHRSRALLALAFVVPWLLASAALGARVGGRRAGALLALLLGLSFATIPYLALVTTDTAVSLGFALTFLAAARWLERPTASAAALGGAALGLAMAAKFTGVFAVVPLLVAALLGGRDRPLPARARRLLGHGLLVAAVASLVVWITYAAANRRLEPARAARTIELYASNQGTLLVDAALLPRLDELLALDRHSPEAAQWATGLLGIAAQNSIGVYPSFIFGEVDRRGRWWYFPVLLALKTSLPVLLVSLLAAGEWLRRRRSAPPTAPRPLVWMLTASAAVYLALAITSSYNLGLRHLFPVMPLLLLPAACWASRRLARAVALVTLLAVEALLLAPDWIPATNTWWLGARNPTAWSLGAGNVDWNQGLLGLDAAVAERRLQPIAVLDPLVSDAEIAAYVRGGRAVRAREPLVPGWYALSLTTERLLPAILHAPRGALYHQESYVELAADWEATVAELRRRGVPGDEIARVYRLYRIPGPGAASAPR